MVNQYPTAPKPLFSHRSPEMEHLKSRLRDQTSDFSNRLKLIENRISVLRNHLNIIDTSLIEKHKATISELRTVEGNVRNLRADVDEIKNLAERLIKRLEDFASKEEIKVLERYVELWQPLKYVTHSEIESLVKNILKEKEQKNTNRK